MNEDFYLRGKDVLVVSSSLARIKNASRYDYSFKNVDVRVIQKQVFFGSFGMRCGDEEKKCEIKKLKNGQVSALRSYTKRIISHSSN